MKIKVFILSFLIIVCCSNKASDSFPSYPDKSLKIEDYIKRGVPSPDRVWHSFDYEKAMMTLNELKNENKLFLPRKNSPNSGLLFSRITSEENIQFLNDTLFTNAIKGKELFQLIQNFQKSIFLYYETDEIQKFSAEVIELLVFTLKLTENAFNFADQLTLEDAIIKDSTAFENGKKQMKSGLTPILIGSIQTLKEYKAYDKKDILIFSTYLSKFIPLLYKRLDNSVQLEISTHIKELSEKHEYPEVKKDMKQVLEALKN